MEGTVMAARRPAVSLVPLAKTSAPLRLQKPCLLPALRNAWRSGHGGSSPAGSPTTGRQLQIVATSRSPLSAPQRSEPTLPVEPPANLIGVLPWAVTLIAVCLVAAVGGIEINLHSDALCGMAQEGSKPCTDIPFVMKVPLIATHLLAFGLMPTGMWVFFNRAPLLKGWGAASPFAAVAGLSMLMVSIAGEMGWHVTQHWYYQDEFMILNAMFYAFLVLGTALWAVGIKDTDDGDPELTKAIDVGLLAGAPLSMIFYFAAASGAIGGSKVPIFIILSLEYAILSFRLWQLLEKDNRVWLFPFFSVGVNLYFISLLDKYQTDIWLNPLFHILHDFGGTELGVAIAIALVWLAPNRIGTKDDPTQKQLK